MVETRLIAKVGAILVTTVLLTNCTVIPGSKLNGKSTPSSWVSETSDDIKTDVEFVQITPSVIRKLQTLKPKAQPNPPELQKEIANYEYKIGVNDVLTIIVYEHPEITIPAGSYRGSEDSGNKVYPDGTIYFPYIGKLNVVGKTTYQVQKEIAEKLSRVIEAPQIDVKVAAYNSQFTYISGEVMRPGVLPINSQPMTLIDAITLTGGLTPTADLANATLTRNGVTKKIDLSKMLEHGDFSQNDILRAGDSLNIARNDYNKVFVMGEVNQAQSLPIDRSGISLAEAISSSGGIDENTANARGIFVLRNVDIATSGPDAATDNTSQKFYATAYQLNASDATAFLLAEQFKLKPRDVVYVTAAPIALWNRLVSQLLPSIISANSINEIENR